MKTILTSLLLTLSIAATAQQSRSSYSSTSTSINDDDKTLSIQIEGTANGKDVRYNRTFSVVGMSKAQKEALKTRVLDSLGLGEPPKPPMPPTPPVYPGSTMAPQTAADEANVTFVCPSCAGRMRLEVSGPDFSFTHETDNRKKTSNAFPMSVPMKPGQYQYTYWQNGVEQMKLPFTVKAGETNVVTIK
jgi:hypothetical protein